MALFVDLVALSNGLHGSVQMDSVALFSWIGWLRHRGILTWKVPTIKDYYLFSSILFNKIFHSLDYPKDFYNQSVCYVDCV